MPSGIAEALKSPDICGGLMPAETKVSWWRTFMNGKTGTEMRDGSTADCASTNGKIICNDRIQGNDANLPPNLDLQNTASDACYSVGLALKLYPAISDRTLTHEVKTSIKKVDVAAVINNSEIWDTIPTETLTKQNIFKLEVTSIQKQSDLKKVKSYYFYDSGKLLGIYISQQTNGTLADNDFINEYVTEVIFVN